MQKPNLAILLSRFPHPHFKGDSLRAYYQIVDLSQHFNIYLHCLVKDMPGAYSISIIKQYVTQINCYPLETLDAILEVGLHFFNGLPNQVNMLTDEDIFWEMQDNLSAQNIDVVYCQLARMAKYALTINKPKVLDFQDAFSANYTRSIKNSNWYWKIIFSLEAKRMRKFENKLANKFNKCTIISEADKNEITNNSNITVVPNGVDFYKYLYINKAREFDVCFVGNLSYLPNVQAVSYLVNNILPKLIEQKPTIKILIAGANPTDAVINLCKHNNITLQKNVPDIVSVYNNAQIFVAPLFAGAGLQNKILEAMSCGVACITTEIVSHSFEALPKNSILIANDVDTFVQQIVFLLENNLERGRQSLTAMEFVKENYNWYEINQKLISILLQAKNSAVN